MSGFFWGIIKIARLSFQRSFAVLLGLFYPPCPPKGIFFPSPSFFSIKFCFLPQAFAAVSLCVVTNFLQWHTHKHTHIKKNISSNNPVTLNQEYATHPHPLKFSNQCRLFLAHLSAWFVDPLGLAKDWPERNACLFRGFHWDLRPPPPGNLHNVFKSPYPWKTFLHIKLPSPLP